MADRSPPKLDQEALLATLQHLEERLLRPELRSSAKEVADLLADDFIEFGRSGRIYDKPQTVEALASEVPGFGLAERLASHFHASQLAEGVVLLTYRSVRRETGNMAHSLRSSIWAWRKGRWQMVFHQGTPADGIA